MNDYGVLFIQARDRFLTELCQGDIRSRAADAPGQTPWPAKLQRDVRRHRLAVAARRCL